MKLIYYIWSLFERFGTNVISFAGNIILAYLLLPDDFGLVAMVQIFGSVSYILIDCGVSDGVLMRANPTRTDFNTVFFFTLATGLIICLLYIAGAPLIASIYGHEELKPIMMVLGLGAVFSGLSVSQLTRLRSQLAFKKLSLINIVSICIAAGVAIAMALMGCRYWALVELQVGFSFSYFMLLLITSKWDLKWEFDWKRFKELWSFGVNLLLSNIATQVALNIYPALMGKAFATPAQAGYMGQAQKLQQTPCNSLESTISTTSYILIAKYETSEKKSDVYVRMFGIMTFVNALFCMVLLALSVPLIDFIFPDKWLPAIPYFQILLCWALIYPVGNFMYVLFKLFDKTNVIRNVSIVEKTIIVLAALVFFRYGVFAMVCSTIFISACSLLYLLYKSSSVTGVSMGRMLAVYLTNVLLAATAGAAAWGVTQLMPCPSWAQLIAGAAVFLAVATILCRLFRPHYYQTLREKFHREK